METRLLRDRCAVRLWKTNTRDPSEHCVPSVNHDMETFSLDREGGELTET